MVVCEIQNEESEREKELRKEISGLVEKKKKKKKRKKRKKNKNPTFSKVPAYTWDTQKEVHAINKKKMFCILNFESDTRVYVVHIMCTHMLRHRWYDMVSMPLRVRRLFILILS